MKPAPVAEEGVKDDSCFEAQVGALLTADGMTQLDVIEILVEETSVNNTILDTGSAERSVLDHAKNKFRGI